MGIFAGVTLQDLMMWLVCGLFIARWVYYAWQKAIAINKCKDYLKRNKELLFIDEEQEELLESTE